MLEFLAALILAASLAAPGDPEVPGSADPPIIVSGGGGNSVGDTPIVISGG